MENRKKFIPTPKLGNNIRHRKKKNRRKKRKNKHRGTFEGGVKRGAPRPNFLWPNKHMYTAMASWAQSFSIVSWQSKHEVSYWKAKATALEYENKILHDIIRKNQLGNPLSSSSSDVESVHQESCENSDNDEIEVSPEYIEFLIANKKFRDDAKREREKFARGSNHENMDEITEDNIMLNEEANIARNKDLYGSKYRKVVACEMSLDKKFLETKDKLMPQLWPSTPLNLNVHF